MYRTLPQLVTLFPQVSLYAMQLNYKINMFQKITKPLNTGNRNKSIGHRETSNCNVCVFKEKKICSGVYSDAR